MNYYDSQEVVDVKLFRLFNERTNKYKDFQPNVRFSRIDVDAINEKDEVVKVELKQRFCTINAFDTIFIEVDKAKELQKCTCPAYYMNFFQTADVIAIWDMHTIDLSKIKIQYNVKIWDKGAEEFKWVDRYLLPLHMADLYFWNEKENKYDFGNAIYY